MTICDGIVYTEIDIKLSQRWKINVHEQRGAFMFSLNILLVAIACITIPLFVASIMLDIFYAEKKQVRFSLRRTSMWYSCMFALSFIPSVLYMTLK